MSALKVWLARRADCFGDEAVKFGLCPPRGVLMLGVQGAGKSLAAKAVATAWQRPLLRLDVGSLYDKFIGESERRLREALRSASEQGVHGKAITPFLLDRLNRATGGESLRANITLVTRNAALAGEIAVAAAAA